jgi:hypothetical protein
LRKNPFVEQTIWFVRVAMRGAGVAIGSARAVLGLRAGGEKTKRRC